MDHVLLLVEKLEPGITVALFLKDSSVHFIGVIS